MTDPLEKLDSIRRKTADASSAFAGLWGQPNHASIRTFRLGAKNIVPEMISEIEPLLDQSGFGEADTRTLTLLAPDIADFEWHNDVTITAQPKENCPRSGLRLR